MKKESLPSHVKKTFNDIAHQLAVQDDNIFKTIYNTGKFISFQLLDAAVSAYAGQAAFMLILSFFPFIMFLLALLQYTSLSPAILISLIENFFPISFREFMSDLILNIYHTQSATILPVTAVTALWLGSRSFLSIIYGLNSVYGIPETRGFLLLRLWAVLYTLLFAVLIVALLVLFVFGNQIFYHLAKMFPILTHVLMRIISLRATVGFILMLIFFTGLYILVPDHKSHKKSSQHPAHSQRWRKIAYRQQPWTKKNITILSQLPGALTATISWLGFSYLYSFYVDHISNYASFYGTMTVIALLMVWLYACMYILFFGGWLNDTLLRLTFRKRQRSLGTVQK